jgi:hypothetical protein
VPFFFNLVLSTRLRFAWPLRGRCAASSARARAREREKTLLGTIRDKLRERIHKAGTAEVYKGTRFFNVDPALVVKRWLHRVDEDTSGVTLELGLSRLRGPQEGP